MNILGLVFSLLLILSYSFWATWEKSTGSRRLGSAYLGIEKINRKYLNHFESELYQSLRQKPSENPASAPAPPSPPREAKIPDLNEPCARLNLLPLIVEGRDEHPFLYETAAKLFRTFYQPLFQNQPRFEYRFLDQLLASIKTALQKESPFALEKLSLNDASLQPVYYRMLRGTKEWDLASNTGLPPLLDYLKCEPSAEKLCLFHAHPDLLSVLFNPKAAKQLFRKIHQEKAPPLTKELLEQICSEAHIVALDARLFDLLELGRPSHKSDAGRSYIETDETSHISIRKRLYLNPS